jgi:hypothetical protein
MFKFNSSLFISLVLILCYISCNGLSLSSLSKYADSFKSIDYQSNLVELISQAKTADSYDTKTLQSILDQILVIAQRIQEEQSRHDELFKNMTSQCLDEQVFRKREVSDAEDANKRSQKSKGDCENSKNVFFNQQQTMEQLKISFNAHYGRVKDQLDSQKNLIKSFIHDYDNVIKYSNEVLEEFQSNGKSSDSTSFLQVKEKFITLTKKLPEFIALSSEDFSSESIENLKIKLEAVITIAGQRHKDNLQLEQKNSEDFSTYENSINKLIQDMDDQYKAAHQQVMDMQDCIEEEKKIIEAALSKLLRNQNLLESTQAMCKSYEKTYEDASVERKKSVEMLVILIKIVEEKFKGVSDYFKNYLEEVKDGFKKYLNKSELPKYEEHKFKIVENNINGEKLARENRI